MIEKHYLKFLRVTGADLHIDDFVRLYWLRNQDSRIKIPKAIDAWFDKIDSAGGAQIRKLIADYNAGQISKLEQDIFKQKKRLADAERTLQTKTTKKAMDDKRIATDKIEWALGKLADVKRTDVKDRDARIFPMWYAPIVIEQDGKRIITPMRYQCRPAGKPAKYDVAYPGTYNARRDNLEGFWRGQFGSSHGLMVATAFFENVSKHKLEQRELMAGEKEQNVILEFKPNTGEDMIVACLWSRWQAPAEPDLLSFAAITDEPPEEVAAAGHDRCIIPIQPRNIDAWLKAGVNDLAAQYALLDDRERPYYEHRMAA